MSTLSEYQIFLSEKYINDLNILKCDISGHEMIISELNPISSTSKCIVFRKIRSEYYVHTYDPNILINNLIQINKTNEYIDEYISVLKNNINMTKTEKCANVISICIYFDKSTDINKLLYTYLYSIKKTIDNVKKNLPYWIVRLYLDYSVVNSILANNNHSMYSECIQIIQYIFSSNNTEIFTFFCNELIDNNLDKKKLRIFRYNALCDKNTNITIVREADGVVSNLDCHNIKIFEKSDCIFYLPHFILKNMKFMKESDTIHFQTIFDSNINPYDSYKLWGQLYKKHLSGNFYKSMHTFHDLLAGCFSTKIKLTWQFYIGSFDQTTNNIDKYIDEQGIDKNMALINGFDEILILDLFKDILSVKIKTIENKYVMDSEYYKLIDSTILPIEIIKIFFDGSILTDQSDFDNKLMDQIIDKFVSNRVIGSKNLDSKPVTRSINYLYKIDNIFDKNEIIHITAFNIFIKNGKFQYFTMMATLNQSYYDNDNSIGID